MSDLSIKELKAKPVAMMTGEELAALIGDTIKPTNLSNAIAPARRYCYGIEGIAQIFGYSVPTASRIKKSGIIDAAITQVGRKIVVDAEMASELAGRNANSANGTANLENCKPWRTS